MFSYYGSKSKLVDSYPSPRFGTIIEPFAGSARYALKYYDREVVLIDNYEIIVRVWKFLQTCEPQTILDLPNLREGVTIDRNDFEPIELAWLFGFMVQQGVERPRLTVSKFGEKNIPRQKKAIAQNLHKIKHWQIIHGSYDEIQNQPATWFIDPPYQFKGEHYVKSNKHLDYAELGSWCQSRMGQTIVCENSLATWLDFYPMRALHGTTKNSMEMIWSNLRHDYQGRQLKLKM